MAPDGYVQRDLSNVRPGEFILDPAGKPWKVLGRNQAGILLIDQAGAEGTAPFGGPVLVWDGEMQRAVATVQNVLGGQVVADSSLTR